MNGHALRAIWALALALCLAAAVAGGFAEENAPKLVFSFAAPAEGEPVQVPRWAGLSFTAEWQGQEEIPEWRMVIVREDNGEEIQEEALEAGKEPLSWDLNTDRLPLDCGIYTVKALLEEEVLGEFTFGVTPGKIVFPHGKVTLQESGAYELALDGRFEMRFEGEIRSNGRFPQIKIKNNTISVPEDDEAAWQEELNKKINESLEQHSSGTVNLSLGNEEGFIAIDIKKAPKEEGKPAPTPEPATEPPAVETPTPTPEPTPEALETIAPTEAKQIIAVTLTAQEQYIVEREETLLLYVQLDSRLAEGQKLLLTINGQETEAAFALEESTDDEETNDRYVCDLTENVKGLLGDSEELKAAISVNLEGDAPENAATAEITVYPSEVIAASYAERDGQTAQAETPTLSPAPVETPTPTPEATPEATIAPIQMDHLGVKYAFLNQADHEVEFNVAGQEGETIKVSLETVEEDGVSSITKEVKDGKVSFTYAKLANAQKLSAYYDAISDQTQVYPIYHAMEDAPKDAEKNSYLLLLNADFTPMLSGVAIDENNQINEDINKISVRVNGKIKIYATVNGQEAAEDLRSSNNFVPFILVDDGSRLRTGDEIAVKATDDFGAESEKRYVVQPVDLIPLQAQWTVDGLDGAVVEDGRLYLSNLNLKNKIASLRVTGHEKRDISLTIEPNGGEPIQGKTNDRGQCVLAVPVADLNDGNYTLTVSYQDQNGQDDLNGKSEMTIDNAVVFTVRDAIVREGAQDIRVQSESKATVTLYVNNEVRDEKQADENGFAVLASEQPLRLDDQIMFEVKDQVGNILKSPWAINEVKLTLSAREKSAGTLYVSSKKSQEAVVSGLEGAQVDLYLAKDEQALDGETPAASVTLDGEGQAVYAVTADALSGWARESTPLYLVAKYAQDTRTASLALVYDPACDLQLSQDAALTAAAKTLDGKADPNATVWLEVKRGDSVKETVSASADGEGAFDFNLSGLKLQAKDVVTLWAQDEAGNESERQSIQIAGGGSIRPQMLFLLVAGLILFGFSLLWFLTTKKKIDEMEDMNKAADKTVRVSRKKR